MPMTVTSVPRVVTAVERCFQKGRTATIRTQQETSFVQTGRSNTGMTDETSASV